MDRSVLSRRCSVTLDRWEKRPLLSLDKPARTAPDLHSEGKLRAENAIADQARGSTLGERSSHPIKGGVRCRVHVDDAPIRSDRVGSDQEPLEDTLRVSLHEVSIREEAGEALFSVHHEVSRYCRHVPADLPFHGGGAQLGLSGGFEVLDDFPRSLTVQEMRECRVTVAEESVIEADGMEVTASFHDQATLPREEGVASRWRKASPTLAVPGHALEACQGRVAASHCGQKVGNDVPRQMGEGEPRPTGALDLHRESCRAHTMTGAVENFCVEPPHGRQQAKRLDHLPGAQGLAARAALDQESEFGSVPGSGLRFRAQRGETLSSGSAGGMPPGKV